MKKAVKSTLVLVGICAIMAVLLALTNAITAPIIQKNQDAAANEALLQVMPEGEGFEEVALGEVELPASVTKVYKEANGGYVFELTTKGYGTGFVIMCGVDADLKVTGAVCLASNETLGHEKTYGDNFVGKDLDGAEAVNTVSGATMTTSAYKNAIKDAINAAIILGGGSVDLRDEAQKLQDNLAAALPAANGEFTEVTMVKILSEIQNIDGLYTANNGTGYVYVVGEEYVAVETGATPENAIVAAAHDILAKTPAVDLTAYEGLPSALVSAYTRENGDYILEMKAAGYGINGGNQYHPASGEYIKILLIMSPEGKIIDCLTVSHGESVGFGDVCANESFYGQFDGKTEADYKDVDAISGATFTNDGYFMAIERAFESVRILEGGAVNEE